MAEQKKKQGIKQRDKEQLDEEQIHVEALYTEAPEVEVSYEELESVIADINQDIEAEDLVDTSHTDGSTTNPYLAQQQGLVYTPPSDPPVLPSDDPQGVEVAAGFAQSMEESNPDVIDLPDRVDNQDLDLENDIYESLRTNSETSHLEGKVQVVVRGGVVLLLGTVFSEDDIGIVEEQIRSLTGIVDVNNQLEVAEGPSRVK